MALTDITERYAAMQLIASNSSLKTELAQQAPSKDRVDAFLDMVGIESQGVRDAVEAVRSRSFEDRTLIAGAANLLHQDFFGAYPDICPPDGYAPLMVTAWKNLDKATESYPAVA